MRNIRSHFRFNKQERSGIFFLLLLIFGCQMIHYFVQSNAIIQDSGSLVPDEIAQAEIDVLKAAALEQEVSVPYRFNPNYINDFKGYTLGLSPEEIDRFLKFRALGNYVNSPEEFRKISGISDSKLKELVPYFKFPRSYKPKGLSRASERRPRTPESAADLQDINNATAEDLIPVYGIGETLSNRIIKFRDALGGFLVDEQLKDVYGLEEEVAERILEKFTVIDRPTINKIDLNAAETDELTSILYINYDLAQMIVSFRTAIGGFSSFDELTEIPGFPTEKIERIKLYLFL
ncbi:MAG: helix-hairpin-helix domain-containing protein [Eudoraea sp.]|nr:helix-hairpin-helix domain-containing protein [Eudoraea sp.]